MRLAVFGAGGALGQAVVTAGAAVFDDVLALRHEDCDISDSESVAAAFSQSFDVAINCAGAIPLSNPTDVWYVRVNTLGPHVLALYAQHHDRLLLHVSTDCVFSGRLPQALQYSYNATPDATEMYGRSKALGEPPEALVVRTSFVTPRHGLMQWLISQQDGAIVPGWAYAMWSGSTVYAVADALVDLALRPPTRIGIHHLATLHPISKAEALRQMVEALRLDLTVDVEFEHYVNRALANSLPGRHLQPFEEALRQWHE